MQTGQAMDFERMILDTLAQDIDEHPRCLQLVDAALVERLQRLVAGVEIDLDQQLPPELGDAGMP
ncbi:MAG: type II toxin-antitoxin system PrlF family antitoxin [Pseudomonas sp.]|nr:type II toxin-antitoxin system PrlF family antitoxin [Pseudomonas sp.]